MATIQEIKSKFNIYKRTTQENPGIREEFEDMAMLDMDFLCLIILSDTDTKLWLSFKGGIVDYGEGAVDNPTLTFTTSLDIFKGIIYGEIEISSAHETGDVTFGGAGEALMDFQAITSVINEFLENI